jgi:hypothetical protein
MATYSRANYHLMAKELGKLDPQVGLKLEQSLPPNRYLN